MNKKAGKSETPVENAEKMRLHPITLAFCGSQSHLEKPFLDDYFIGSLPIVRFACLLAFFLYALFGILDAYLIPDKKHIFWIFRYMAFCPLALGAFFLSFFPPHNTKHLTHLCKMFR